VTIVDVALCHDRDWLGNDRGSAWTLEIATQCAANTERTVSIGIATTRSWTQPRLEGTVKAAGVNVITSLRLTDR